MAAGLMTSKHSYQITQRDSPDITQTFCLSFPLLCSFKPVLTFSYQQASLLMAPFHPSKECVLTLVTILAHLSIELQLPILHQSPKALPNFLMAVVLAQCNLVLQYSSCFLIWYPFCVPDFASAQQELCRSCLRDPLGTHHLLVSSLMSAQEEAQWMPDIR